MIVVSKVFATVFAVLVLARSFTDYRKRKESLQMTLFWVLIWVAILTLAYFPSLIESFVNLLGGERTGLGTIFGMALVFILFINYRIYIKANRAEKTLGEIARIISLWEIRSGRSKAKTVDKK